MHFKHDWIVVGIPVFNEAKFVAATIDSLKMQEWTDFTALIADNCSTDASEAVIRSAICGDPRFHYIRHETNRGAVYNAAFLLERTSSPYFMCLGAHDLLASDFLQVHINALEAHPTHSLSYSYTQWIDETGAPLKVTKASRLASFGGGPVCRYLQSVVRISEGTAVNNVIRRSALSGSKIRTVPGTDRIFLSELLFKGPAHEVPRPLYFRRDLQTRADRLKRLVGDGEPIPDRRSMVDAYCESFDELTANRILRVPAKLLLRFLLRWNLDAHFAPRRLLRGLAAPLRNKVSLTREA